MRYNINGVIADYLQALRIISDIVCASRLTSALDALEVAENLLNSVAPGTRTEYERMRIACVHVD